MALPFFGIGMKINHTYSKNPLKMLALPKRFFFFLNSGLNSHYDFFSIINRCLVLNKTVILPLSLQPGESFPK